MFSCKLLERRIHVSLRRIYGILLQEFYITRVSLEIIVDIFLAPAMSIIVFGYFTMFLTGEIKTGTTLYLFLGMFLWQFVFLLQYSVSLGCLWNIWSRNLTNMFIAPLTITEYFLSYILSSIIKACLLFVLLSVISYILFDFSIFSIGVTNLLLFFLNIALFSWALGITIVGFIFYFGQRFSAVAWGLVFFFQPLTAAFFPVSVLPPALQTIAWIFPLTYVFEAARINIADQTIQWQLIIPSFIGNCIFLVLSFVAFAIMFRKSKENGQFARNEG